MTVICAECGRGTDRSANDPCSHCAGAVRLAQRYVLVEVLGRHGTGTTYRAQDTTTGADVVVKELQLRATQELKEVELFEREAALLANLDHPDIPALRDHFEVQRGKSVSLYTVQDYVDGESLEALAAARNLSQIEVARHLADAADLLHYIHTRTPPVIHRDVKPANLLLRGGDDRLTLIDFGAARSAAETLHRSGSTIAGTFGYMAPEQLVGSAVPASDTFGLGATGVRLLTGREPHELWGDGHRLEFDRTAFDAGLVGLLDTLTAPDPTDRPADLRAVASELRRFAGGETRVLHNYATRTAVAVAAHGLPRPSRRTAWRGFHKAFVNGTALPIIPPLLAIRFLGSGVAAIPVAVTLLTMTALFMWLFARPMFADIRVRRAAARIFARGTAVRGLITDREVDSLHYWLHYQYTVGGVEMHGSTLCGEDDFVSCEPGDEVGVWYNPDNPAESAAARIPRQLPA